MIFVDKFAISETQPNATNICWAKPVDGGFALYLYFDGKWQVQRLMNNEGTYDPDDDKPIDIHEGQLGPDTVGTEQIIDNSVVMDDLNDSVKDKIQKTYVEDDEALHMDYDIQAELEGE